MRGEAVRRIAATAATVLFAWMAVIQFNDPDPLYWVTVYAATAWVTGAAAAGRRLAGFTLLTLGVVFAGLLMAFPGFVEFLRAEAWGALGARMSPDRPWIESAREFIGLLMASVALLLARGRAGAGT